MGDDEFPGWFGAEHEECGEVEDDGAGDEGGVAEGVVGGGGGLFALGEMDFGEPVGTDGVDSDCADGGDENQTETFCD